MVPAGSGAILVLDFFVMWAVVLHGRDATIEEFRPPPPWHRSTAARRRIKTY